MSRAGSDSDDREAQSAEPLDYLALTVSGFLDVVGAPAPAPAGGSVAALAATMAAALAAMTARLSLEHWELAGAAVAQAEVLRARLAPLAREDAAAYQNALAHMRSARDRGVAPAPRVENEVTPLARALARAAAVPLQIAEAAADVAELATDIARLGNPAVAADAATAVALASAAARATAHIVAVNLSVSPDDEMLVRAKHAAKAAETASARAFAAVQ